MLNTMVCIKWSTTIILYGVARLTLKLILQDSKLNKKNYACALLSMWIAKAIIKSTQTYVCSGNIVSIENNIPKSIKNFITAENNWFAQLWAAYKHDYERNQDLFTKCLKEQFAY